MYMFEAHPSPGRWNALPLRLLYNHHPILFFNAPCYPLSILVSPKSSITEPVSSQWLVLCNTLPVRCHSAKQLLSTTVWLLL